MARGLLKGEPVPERFKSIHDPKLIQLLIDGAVGVLPTDTVYGLVASARDEAAATRLYKLKHRHHKPGTIIAASIDQLVDLGIPRRYLKVVEQYWPGPVSVIVPTEMNLGYLHLGKFSLACRIPGDQALRGFLGEVGPLITTSANHAGQKIANTIHEAEKYFKDEVDFYVANGDLSDHKPSTIIRIVDDAVAVVRKGDVKIDEESGTIIQ